MSRGGVTPLGMQIVSDVTQGDIGIVVSHVDALDVLTADWQTAGRQGIGCVWTQLL